MQQQQCWSVCWAGFSIRNLEPAEMRGAIKGAWHENAPM